LLLAAIRLGFRDLYFAARKLENKAHNLVANPRIVINEHRITGSGRNFTFHRDAPIPRNCLVQELGCTLCIRVTRRTLRQAR
jgi:hypothetical protein